MVTPSLKFERTQELKRAQGIGYPTFKRLYTLKEAAEYLGRSEWSMRELVYSGSIRVVRVRRKIYLDIEDLSDFISRNKSFYS